MQVVKRDGRRLRYDRSKIKDAIAKAFKAVRPKADNNLDIIDVTDRVHAEVSNRKQTEALAIENIQDLVEKILMERHYYEVAKAYILYRNKRAQERSSIAKATEDEDVEFRELCAKNSVVFGNNPMREFVYMRTYSRWIEQKGRREIWSETVDRYVQFLRVKLGQKLSDTDYEDIRQYIFEQRVMPSMRLLQFAGPAASRCNVCVYNCAFSAPACFKDLADIMYLSMSGTGVGFSVEEKNVAKFPNIKPSNGETIHMIIDDSKEGWCDALHFGLHHWFEGTKVGFDYSRLRPAGARLKTMGGRSSGPKPLMDLMKFTEEIIEKRRNTTRRLTTLDVHDITCKIGDIVVSGGIRRSALLSLSDFKDQELRDCKKGSFWLTNSQRSRANNSAAYDQKPDQLTFMKEWISLAESGTGERGIFNRGSLGKVLPQRRVDLVGDKIGSFGMNPCVTADTWVQTVEGPRQVKDLIGKKIDLVVNGKPYPMESEGFFHTGDKQVYDVRTKVGYSVKITDDHPLLEYKTQKWTKLKDLKVGDQICLSNHNGLAKWAGQGTFDHGEADVHHDLCDEFGSTEYHRGYLSEFFNVFHTGPTGLDLRTKHFNPQTSAAVQRMLARFGIISSSYQENDYWVNNVYCTMYNNFQTLIRGLNAELFEHETDTFMDSIESITKLGVEPVYDVTVAEVHEFCANGLRVSNCGEILLQPFQFCNLTEVVLRADDTWDKIRNKMRVATLIGTCQAYFCDFKYIDPKWRENQEDERLLGVSLTGIYDCAPMSAQQLRELRDSAVQWNIMYAKKLGINPATAITCVKPSGTVSQMVDSASGIHPRFAEHYIRRIRISATDPLLQLMKDQGYPCLPEVGQFEPDISTYVLEFPVQAPTGATTVKDVTALSQLNTWLHYKRNWAEHNPSVTIYVKADEWMAIGNWVWDNWDYITGLSFLPYSDHIYELAPYEAIDKKKYLELSSKIKKVDFSKLRYYEKSDTTDVKKEMACVGGVCEL